MCPCGNDNDGETCPGPDGRPLCDPAPTGPPPTPELDRMIEASASSQPAGEFLEWLSAQGYQVCTVDEHDRFFPTYQSTQGLLASWLGINLDKVETERRAVLEYVRWQHAEYQRPREEKS